MVEDHDVVMNKIIKDAKGIDLNVVDYSVNFGEDGVGGGSGGLGFEVNNNEIIVDSKLSEDNKDFFKLN
jgi:hypothetical protein